MKKIRPEWALLVLPVLYGVGLFGMIFYKSVFIPCTPFLLLLCFFCILWAQKNKNPDFWRIVILAIAAGYGIELVGVTTGKVFGHYWYGSALGPKVAGVPPLIGINWCMLLLGASSVTGHFLSDQSTTIKALATAVLMTLLDAAMEPVCKALDMWEWGAGMAPLKNYLSWFVFSFLLSMVYYTFEAEHKNRVAFTVFVLQAIFFISLTGLRLANIF